MILDTSLSLVCVLSGGKSATDPHSTVDFTEWNDAGEQTPPATYRNALNGTTPVTILPAPTGKIMKRDPVHLSIQNKDNASITLRIYTTDGTTIRDECYRTLLTLQTLTWDKQQGFQVLTVT